MPGETPSGVPVADSDEFEALRAEAMKDPVVGPVEWARVEELASGLLASQGKDFLVGSYLAAAQVKLHGYAGLSDGLSLLEGLVEVHWETGFPALKRLRGRANAFAWFSETAASTLESVDVDGSNAEAVAASMQTLESLDKLLRERIDDPDKIQLGALTRTLREAKARADANMPTPGSAPGAATPAASEAPATNPQTGDGAAQASPAAVQASVATSATATPTTSAAPSELKSKSDAVSWMLKCVAFYREKEPTAPTALRLLRIARWSELSAAPPDSDGKTQLLAPAAERIGGLRSLREASNWGELLMAAESAFRERPLWLDAQRHAAHAAEGLGAPYAAVRRAILDELRSLLERMPSLPKLAFQDGTPFADDETREWIQQEVLAGGPPGAGATAPAAAESDVDPEALAAARGEARELARKGQLAPALERLRGLFASEPGAESPRARFLARFELADLCVETGSDRVALPLLEELDEEARAHGLGRWEPQLATQVLVALYRCRRRIASKKSAPPEAAQAADDAFARLCRIDPVAAAALD